MKRLSLLAVLSFCAAPVCAQVTLTAGLRITSNTKAKPGAYRLLVTATANNKKATSTLRIRLR